MSVDLYLEQTAQHARCVIVRLLGGLDYWRYGAEEFAALCRARGIPLALLPGDGGDDPALAALSTVAPEAYARLDACFRHGGPANMARALTLAAHLAGVGPDDGDCAEPMDQHGVHSLDAADGRPLAAVVFYRSHLASGDFAPITALAEALRARGLAVGTLFAASLKAPATAAFVATTLRGWRPALCSTPPVSRPGRTATLRSTPPECQCCNSCYRAPRATPGPRRAAACRRPILRCRLCCRNWTDGC